MPAFDADSIEQPIELKLLQRFFTILLEQKAGEKHSRLVIGTATDKKPKTDAVPPSGRAVTSIAAAEPARPLASVCDSYLSCARFALERVRPLFEKHGFELDSATAAAITATLFIERCRRESGR
ncbi:MAG: hypothetical protein ACR2G6_02035 [Gemmatimonadaceae bacterium]